MIFPTQRHEDTKKRQRNSCVFVPFCICLIFIPIHMFMKKLTFIFCLLLACAGLHSRTLSDKGAFRQWQDNKYSMFIHFGLYSELGGVWNGQPVRQGYSEQIMAFAPIPKPEYEALALRFNPTQFNADSIAALAKHAGMRSIVLTSKHHDGFCPPRANATS